MNAIVLGIQLMFVSKGKEKISWKEEKEKRKEKEKKKKQEEKNLNDFSFIPSITWIKDIKSKTYVVPKSMDEDGLCVFKIILPMIFIGF